MRGFRHGSQAVAVVRFREVIDQHSLPSDLYPALIVQSSSKDSPLMANKKSDLYSSIWASCNELHPNEVLVATIRPNLQPHLLFKGEVGRLFCSSDFCVLRCREGVTHPSYVFFHLFAGCVNRQMDALLTGSSYPAIDSGDVRALQIPLPPHPEQTAIADVLTEMHAEQRREKTRALKQAIMKELLTGRTRLI
jgi:hypothetical protein